MIAYSARVVQISRTGKRWRDHRRRAEGASGAHAGRGRRVQCPRVARGPLGRGASGSGSTRWRMLMVMGGCRPRSLRRWIWTLRSHQPKRMKHGSRRLATNVLGEYTLVEAVLEAAGDLDGDGKLSRREINAHAKQEVARHRARAAMATTQPAARSVASGLYSHWRCGVHLNKLTYYRAFTTGKSSWRRCVQRELGAVDRRRRPRREAHAIRHGDAFQRHGVVGVGRGIQRGLRRLPSDRAWSTNCAGVAEEL